MATFSTELRKVKKSPNAPWRFISKGHLNSNFALNSVDVTLLNPPQMDSQGTIRTIHHRERALRRVDIARKQNAKKRIPTHS